MANLRIFTITFLLSSISLAATAVDQSPTAVKTWFETLKPETNNPKLTKLHFYYHNSRNPERNLSAVQVAKAPPAFSDQPPFFGVVAVTDDPLTAGPGIASRRVGYEQGLYATASLEEVSMLMAATFVFTEGDLAGSTLAVLGRNPIGDRYRELPIVGGTGIFRLARGVVTLQTYFFNFTMALAVVEMDLVILHY